MIKIGYNSNGLRNLNVIEAVRNIKKYGYDGIELSFHDKHIHPLKISNKYLEDFKKICIDEGINIICIATGADSLLSEQPFEPSLITPDREAREKRIDLLKRSIEIAKFLQAPVVNFASGKNYHNAPINQCEDLLIEGIQEILKGIGDLVLAIEPEPNFFIGTSESAIELIKKVNHPQFQLNLDIGHVYCCEDDFYDAIDKAISYTRHIHIEDIKNRIHHHEIPGEGDINFQRIFDILNRNKYNHYVSVELYHHAEIWQKALKESREYLRKYIA